MKQLLFVGSCSVDYSLDNGQGFILSSGARGAISAALVKPGDTQIGLVTPLSSNVTPLQDDMRKRMEGHGIQIFSPPFGKASLSIYDVGTNNTPLENYSDSKAFDPSMALGNDQQNPSVAVFTGSKTISSREKFQKYAKELTGKNCTVILDVNTRSPVNEEAFRSWANVASVIRLSEVDIRHLFGANGKVSSDKEAAQTILDWGKDQALGTKLVIVTRGKYGAKGYWLKNQKLWSEDFKAPPTTDFQNEISAGDSFNAGLAIACSELGLTPHTISKKIQAGDVRVMLKKANDVAINFLRVNNGMEGPLPECLQPVFQGEVEDVLSGMRYSRRVHSGPVSNALG